jgi:gamma-glutamyltranspeptidase/glutathione hydrolase
MARAYASGFGGVIASEEPLASYAGARILEAGGNAVDASIAVSFTLAILVPHLGGIGGDFFALLSTPNGRVEVLNGSGQSPRRLSLELLEERGLKGVPERGPLSIVVPGMVGALYEMWRRYGTLEWSKILEVPVKLAREGFPAPPSLVNAVKLYSNVLGLDEGSKLTYLNPPPRLWEPYRFKGMALLLESIALDPQSLYEGEVAEAVAQYVEGRGGLLGLEDMKSYKPEWVEPLKASYKDWVLYEVPPNSQGVTTLHIMKLLEERGLVEDPYGIDRFKGVVEVAIPCYRWRDLNIGDPRYMKVGVKELLSSRVLEEIKGLTSASKSGDVGLHGDTTFHAVADRDGMVVAGIQSLFYPFGSAITEPRFQVTLNNRATGFTIDKGLPNTLAPSKKPLHTLSALIMVDGGSGRVVAVGASGGHYRPQLHAVFATNIIDYSMNLEEAINSPRAAWDWGTGRLVVERGVKGTVQGHVVVERLGVANAVEILGRARGGATDMRGDGVPVALP